MAKLYKRYMLDILERLQIAPPDHIEMDQIQAELLLGKINAALAALDPMPPGDAKVGDVLAGKTFSAAAGVGLTGTLVATDLTADATALAGDIVAGKTAYGAAGKLTGTLVYTQLPRPVMDLMPDFRLIFPIASAYSTFYDTLSVYDGEDELLGYATGPQPEPQYFELGSYIKEKGSFTVKAGYNALAELTLADSEKETLTFTVHAVERVLTGCSDTNVFAFAANEVDFGGTLALEGGSTALPASIVIEVDEVPLAPGTDYTYSDTTGEYFILRDSVTGDIKITATAT